VSGTWFPDDCLVLPPLLLLLLHGGCLGGLTLLTLVGTAQVGGHQVLAENNYTMQEGIATHSQRLAGRPVKPPGRKCAFVFFRAACPERDPAAFAGLSFPERSALASRMWRDLKDGEAPEAMQEYNRLATEDAERHKRAMEEYTPHHLPGHHHPGGRVPD
jgi:hypothetical protein